MKFVKIGDRGYLNVETISYIDCENRKVYTIEPNNNVYSLEKEDFDNLMACVL